MEKLNCWEFKKCGREPSGIKTTDTEVCPAAIKMKANGINDGINGGRCCWAITGTNCEGEENGTYTQLLKFNLKKCLYCDFFRMVREQEVDWKDIEIFM